MRSCNAGLTKRTVLMKGEGLMAVGALMALTCGSCTVITIARTYSPAALLFGGVPTLAGLGLFLAGLLRRLDR